MPSRKALAEKFNPGASCEPLGPGIQLEDGHRYFRALLGFRFEGERFIATPQRLFRPRGLMLWEVPPRAMLEQCLVGMNHQILVSCDPVPAQFFTMGQSFEQIQKLLKEGVEPVAWSYFDTIPIGCTARVVVRDKNGELVRDCLVGMWGYTVE